MQSLSLLLFICGIGGGGWREEQTSSALNKTSKTPLGFIQTSTLVTGSVFCHIAVVRHAVILSLILIN